jgi:hypothetical protein
MDTLIKRIAIVIYGLIVVLGVTAESLARISQ